MSKGVRAVLKILVDQLCLLFWELSVHWPIYELMCFVSHFGVSSLWFFIYPKSQLPVWAYEERIFSHPVGWLCVLLVVSLLYRVLIFTNPSDSLLAVQKILSSSPNPICQFLWLFPMSLAFHWQRPCPSRQHLLFQSLIFSFSFSKKIILPMIYILFGSLSIFYSLSSPLYNLIWNGHLDLCLLQPLLQKHPCPLGTWPPGTDPDPSLP